MQIHFPICEFWIVTFAGEKCLGRGQEPSIHPKPAKIIVKSGPHLTIDILKYIS